MEAIREPILAANKKPYVSVSLSKRKAVKRALTLSRLLKTAKKS